MTDTFLFQIAKTLFSKYQGDLENLVVVLPSRRSSLFFTKELTNLIDNPIWLPKFFTIEDFIFSINNLKNANNLELFFAFYNAYKFNIPNGHSIERCYNWANTLLEDFNELDKAHVNQKELFLYLSDLKRIENWYLDIGSHQDEIKDYLIFFNKLYDIYKSLSKNLLSGGIAYPGLSQRLIVDNLELINKWLKQNNKDKIIFIGLDALTNSQEKIIDYLLQNNLCDIFWDSDSYFINNHNQESGKFLRKYYKKWPKTISKIGDDFLKREKKIDIIGTTKQINQTKLLGSLLQQKSYKLNQLHRTAIILPNENLLLSVLESIPKYIKDINVTMGYKVSYHPINSVFSDIITLYVNIKKTDSNSIHKRYLINNIIQLLNNPYFQLLLDDTEEAEKLVKFLRQTGQIYISAKDLKRAKLIHNQSLLKKIFIGPLDKGIELNYFLRGIITSLLEHIEDTEKGIIEQECLFLIEEQLLLFNKFLEKTDEDIGVTLFAKLFNKVIKTSKLHFAGEPLEGIQVMGLLESRAIDFDEVFILSANESELPSSTSQNSFIPFDAKLKFNIRTYLDMDAMSSNTFFNLIKRVRKTHIIYNQDISSFSSGEPSRFINQLLYEVKLVKNTSVEINHYSSTDSFTLEANNVRSKLKQDDFILNKLKILAQNGFSPSSLNLYNYCKRQFYFEKILNISTQDDVANNIDKAMMGSIIHSVLHKLYEPYIETLLTTLIIKRIQDSFERELTIAISEYGIDNVDTGKNLLAFEAIKSIILNFINHENKLIQEGNTITIKFLEHPIKDQRFNLESNEVKLSKTEINLKGHIDRVDIFNNQYRIIDYKTGFIQDSDLRIKNLQNIYSKPKILQLLLYSWLIKKTQHNISLPILAGVINLRAKSFKFQPCTINKQQVIDNSILKEFKEKLHDMLIDMFNPNQDFEHRDRDEKCRFCD